MLMNIDDFDTIWKHTNVDEITYFKSNSWDTQLRLLQAVL